MTDTKANLEKQLWAVADVLRGKMNADEYKNFMLGFIFYKYLSEKLATFVNTELLGSDPFEFENLDEDVSKEASILAEVKKACISELGYYLKPTQLFSKIVARSKKKQFIIEDLQSILTSIEQTAAGSDSEDDFKDLFGDVDLASNKLGSSTKKKNEVISEVLILLDAIDFDIDNPKSDLLGDAYEYLIGQFAAGAGKKGGEFYTPTAISRLLAMIVARDKKRIKSVYDPTCGSGSLLLRITEFSKVDKYFGQELNPTTFNLARMNMILHNIPFDRFEIRNGDTLEEDMHKDLQAEAIVANPPFSAKWKSDKDPALAEDERFLQYGRLAPKGAADYAFVTHMLYHLAENGTMAVVLPHGALFRSGAEGTIRQYIIEKQNYLDAVIGLPSNLFYGTGIPACIMIFKKNRKNDDNIFFIDASKEYKDGKNQNVLTEEHIDKIFKTYQVRKEVDKFAYVAPLSEIAENEYNLNIPRYVDTFEEEEPVDISEVQTEIKKTEKEIEEVKKKMEMYLDELGF